VIDQSLTSDVMAKVNNSLGAIQGALTPYDEAAVFTYGHMTQERTGFTGAQSARLPAVLALAKATGSEMHGARQQRSFCRLQHHPERRLRRSQSATGALGRRQRDLA
jgi:hypothetical protein